MMRNFTTTDRSTICRTVATIIVMLLLIRLLTLLHSDNMSTVTSSLFGDLSSDALLPRSTGNVSFRWECYLRGEENHFNRVGSHCDVSDNIAPVMDFPCHQGGRWTIRPMDHTENTDDNQQSISELLNVHVSIAAVLGIIITLSFGSALVWLCVSFTGISLAHIGIGAASVSGGIGLFTSNALFTTLQHTHISVPLTFGDLIVGAIAGALGSGLGGLSSRVAMQSALKISLPRVAINLVGTATSAVVGGVCGGLAAAAIAMCSRNRTMSTSHVFLAALIGVTAGIGGSLAAGGTMLSWSPCKVIPVELTEADQELIAQVAVPKGLVPASKIFLLLFPEEIGEDFRDATLDMLRTEPNGLKHFTIIVHGDGGRLYVPVRYQGEHVYRPTSPELVGRLASQYRGKTPPEKILYYSNEIKLISCHGAWSNAQRLADVIGQRVWASHVTVDVDSMGSWHPFDPA